MVGNGNIIIKALSEPGDRNYHDSLFWDSIRTSYDAVVTTTAILCSLLGSSTVDFRIRTIHVWDKTSSRYGADQCFERIIPWLVVDGFAKRGRNQEDTVAQVGNAFLQGGVEGGLILAKSQFICLERIRTWGYLDANFKRMRAQRLDTGSIVVVRDITAVQAVEKLLGYVFVDKRLLLEGLTHRNTPPNYERLKFLGDAVYPKDQTKVTMNLAILSVCNATLGMLCLETGLYQHIQHATAMNPHEAAFASVRVRMQDARRNALDLDGAYWLQCKIPKVLADVMESVFGAVFLDSGCQFAPVCELFMRLMEPTLRKHLTDDTRGNDHSARRSS
ncbi:Endoribonuclease Dicer [Dissophora globulifera]|uniref:Endoribonuclease Dicer n=1 Tax=Dissophora globulifera TaxID=979702 RepID=A0A9P6R6T6_9FUNG|nr:Endoribonuclease Dicer [Dissophora globulifera]